MIVHTNETLVFPRLLLLTGLHVHAHCSAVDECTLLCTSAHV